MLIKLKELQIFVGLIAIGMAQYFDDGPAGNLIVDFARDHSAYYATIYDNLSSGSKNLANFKYDSFGFNPKERSLPFTFVSAQNANITKKMTTPPDSGAFRKKSLHVFPGHETNNSHIDYFNAIFNTRPRSDSNVWLLEISLQDANDNDTDGDILGQLEQFVNQTVLDLDDDLFIYSVAIDRSRAKIWEVYRIQDHLPATIKPYGEWITKKGLTISSELKWVRRKDLEGAHLRIQTLRSVPYVSKMTHLSKDPDVYDMVGMFPDVFFSLQGIMNFTYTVTKPPDKTWGSKQADGSWNGMVQQLQAHECDIAVTDFTVTLSRSEVIDFGFSIKQEHMQLFIKNPAGTYNFLAYIEPLHYLSWAIISLFCLVGTWVLFSTTTYGVRDSTYREFTVSKSCVFILSVLTMRGWSHEPTSGASRLAFISIFLAGVMIYWHWEAMLISYLATRVIKLPFTSIAGLIANTDYNIYITLGGSSEDFFKLSGDPVLQEAWKTRIQEFSTEINNQGGYSRGIDVIMDHSTVAGYRNYFGTSASPEYANCEIIAIPEQYDFKPRAYGFQKDSPLLPLFNFYLREMREKGSLKKILDQYESRPQICPDYSGKALGFDNCFTAFVALLGGMAIGLVLLGIEFGSKFLRINLPNYENPDHVDKGDEDDEVKRFLKAQNKQLAKELMDSQATIRILQRQLNSMDYSTKYK